MDPSASDPRPPPGDLAARARAVEAYLAGWIERRRLPARLREGLVYALLGGGKRIRPALVLLAAEAVGGSAEAALPAAGALELVHTFSLVHDDLPALDDDDLRRGRPTLHRHAGEALAVLAGDALLALAFELLSAEVPRAAQAAALTRELAAATNDMIAGQVLDTLPDPEAREDPMQRLLEIHRSKTGALIRCACRCGGLSAGAEGDRLAALGDYGAAVGLMFQMVDDVLDVTQTTEQIGKTARKDAAQSKLTYPGLIGVEASLQAIEAQRLAARRALTPLGARGAVLAELADWLAVRTR